MGLSLFWIIDRATKPKSREGRKVSAPPSALLTLTRVRDQVAPQRRPILYTSVRILTFLAGGMFFEVNF
jgi:hypothetical protein